jgi:hypothetical protein
MNGTAHHTTGGLEKKDLKRNPKTGEIVSKDKAKGAKANPWIKAVTKAKKELGIAKGEMAFPKKGSELYKTAKGMM